MKQIRRVVIKGGVQQALDKSIRNGRRSAGFASAAPKASTADAGEPKSQLYRPSRELVEDRSAEQTTPDRPVRPRRALPVDDLPDDAPSALQRAPIPEPDLESATITTTTLVPGLLPSSSTTVAPILKRPVVKLHSRRLIEPIVIDRLSKSYNGSVAVRNMPGVFTAGRCSWFLRVLEHEKVLLTWDNADCLDRQNLK